MNSKEKFDVYEMVTNQIIQKLEMGVVPWVHYLKAGEPKGYQLPKNFVTRRPYRGINLFLLGMSEFSSPWWLTFKQCEAKGGHVRKGEHGTIIVFWKRLDQPVASLRIQQIVSMAGDRLWDVSFVLMIEKDRHEFRFPTSGLVHR